MYYMLSKNDPNNNNDSISGSNNKYMPFNFFPIKSERLVFLIG